MSRVGKKLIIFQTISVLIMINKPIIIKSTGIISIKLIGNTLLDFHIDVF